MCGIVTTCTCMQPYSLPCVVRRLSHNSTSGGSAAPSTAPVPPGNNPPTEASAMKCPPGATLLSRASIAHPQSLMFCSVLWPAQLAAGLPPPPLAPGLEQSPAERENSSTMRVVVVGPLLGDGEGRSGMGSQRTGVSSAAQLLQLGFRSPLHWVRVPCLCNGMFCLQSLQYSCLFHHSSL